MKNAVKTELKHLAAKDPLEVIERIVQRHNVHQGSTIPILQEIQDTFGFIAPEVLQRLAGLTGIPDSELYSIVTFYSQFRLQPVGKNVIQVCHGTACHLAGAEKITEALQHETGAAAGMTSRDGLFTVEKVACVGCCSLAPVVNVNNETSGRLTPAKARELVRDVRKADAATQEKTGCKGACHHGDAKL